MNPIAEEEGGNLHLVNGSMTKLKDAGAFAENRAGSVKTDTGNEESENRETQQNRRY